MSTLKGLTPAARAALSDDFRRGTVPTVDVAEHVVDLGFGRVVDLEPLREVIAAGVSKFGNDPPAESDPWLGPRVHAALRLTRREAADKRLWEYLTVVEFPEYVRWRWGDEGKEKVVSAVRFMGEDSVNALARLWWIPELTRNGSDYTRAATAMGISRLAVSWMQIKLSHHRPCLLAVVDFLQTLQEQTGRVDELGKHMAKAVNANLRTVCLDMLVPNPPTDADAIRDWVKGKVDATLLVGDELPAGPDEAPVPDEDIAEVRKFLDDLAERIGLGGGQVADGRVTAGPA